MLESFFILCLCLLGEKVIFDILAPGMAGRSIFQRGGPGRKYKSAGRGEKARKSTDPKIRHALHPLLFENISNDGYFQCFPAPELLVGRMGWMEISVGTSFLSTTLRC